MGILGKLSKCLLFTHDAALYSVFVPGLTKPGFAQMGEVFGQRLFKTLLWEEFPQEQIERMLDACRVVHFARSNNRGVLGSMNEMRFHMKWMLKVQAAWITLICPIFITD